MDRTASVLKYSELTRLKLAKLLKIRSIISGLTRQWYKCSYYGAALCKYYSGAIRGSTWKTRMKVRHAKTYDDQSIVDPPKARLALFVAYHQPEKVPRSNLNYLISLNKCKFRIIYIHNGPLEREAIEGLKPYCEEIICRENLGQDFGAWKDGIKYCQEQNILNDLSWLLICNDSNFFLGGKHATSFEIEFRNALESAQYDLIAANKNLEAWFHYQSFFLCFSKEIFLGRAFKKFWENYIPLSHRFHAINNGEIKLTHRVLKNSQALVLYDSPSIIKGIAIKKLLTKDLVCLPLRILLSLKGVSAPCDTEVSNIFIHQMIGHLETFNPSHVFALLYVKYAKSPFLKKDLYQAGSHSLAQIAKILGEEIHEETELQNQIISHYLKTGSIYSYAKLPKEAFKKGLDVGVGRKWEPIL